MTTMTSDTIHRKTLFKVPEAEDQQKLLAAYNVLRRNQAKDGKPYILYIHAAQLMDDPRSQGYTVLAQTAFASLEDMEYFDNECPAHAELKKTVMGLITERPLVVNAKHEGGEMGGLPEL